LDLKMKVAKKKDASKLINRKLQKKTNFIKIGFFLYLLFLLKIGAVAECSCEGLQSLRCWFNSSPRLQQRN
jgi:hypothetical protein